MTDNSLAKTIVVLKADSSSLEAAETFLTNRGWRIFSTTDVRKATSLVLEKRPSYILLSIDHPSKKLEMLPEIFKQSSSTVIAFAETKSSYSENKLIEFAGADYRAFAPVTGPSVERCVNKHLQDSQKKLNEVASDKIISPTEAHWASLENNRSEQGKIIQFENANQANQFLVDCMKKSFYEACALAPRSTDKTSGSIVSSSALCFVVNSPKLSGYLLATQSGQPPLDKNFTSVFEDKFKYELGERGGSAKINDKLPVDLKEVEFNLWADHSAEFLEKSSCNGSEIMIAFFPREEAVLAVEDSEVANMARIDINDLVGNRIVDFDLFIFLPTNNKVILCAAKGSLFCEKQRLRFIKQGRTHLHVQKEDIKAASRYYIESYLNNLVDGFSFQEEAVIRMIRAGIAI